MPELRIHTNFHVCRHSGTAGQQRISPFSGKSGDKKFGIEKGAQHRSKIFFSPNNILQLANESTLFDCLNKKLAAFKKNIQKSCSIPELLPLWPIVQNASGISKFACNRRQAVQIGQSHEKQPTPKRFDVVDSELWIHLCR